ncbi:MAG: alpha/beta hydrolase domain-containing protein [Lachnospiraceae bacterium]
MNISAIISESINRIPYVEGPIPVTKESHPFCSMEYCKVPFHLQDYNYIEEEYFLNGKANVYDTDENDMPVLIKQALPYKNRILVRRPSDMKSFSGRVYIDILNATQGYDIEDLWHRNYLWCMENGHAYIGITSKPINVLSLKNFDYQRYQSLNWSDGEITEAPSVTRSATLPGTEEGLFWDMLSQLGVLLRTNNGNNCLGGSQADYIYLSGQSQSGAYLNTYTYYFDRFLYDAVDKALFDGYLNIVGALVQRTIRQENRIGGLRLYPRKVRPCRTPYICISSEADLYLFHYFLEENLFSIKVANANSDYNKCRYYEIPGTPHTDIACPILPAISEIEKTGSKLPNSDPRLFKTINDIPTEFYICGLLEKLHVWAVTGQAPEVIEPMLRTGDGLTRDQFGNAKGGLRTPFLDIPIASYLASNPEDPEGICGKITYFSRNQFKMLYGSEASYLEKFKEYVEAQVKEGWISDTDGQKMIAWSQAGIRKIK